MLFDLRSRLEGRFDELCRILTQDHGRTMNESKGSMRRVIENVESACAATYGLVKMNEYVDELAGGIDQSLVWEPSGPSPTSAVRTTRGCSLKTASVATG